MHLKGQPWNGAIDENLWRITNCSFPFDSNNSLRVRVRVHFMQSNSHNNYRKCWIARERSSLMITTIISNSKQNKKQQHHENLKPSTIELDIGVFFSFIVDYCVVIKSMILYGLVWYLISNMCPPKSHQFHASTHSTLRLSDKMVWICAKK